MKFSSMFLKYQEERSLSKHYGLFVGHWEWIMTGRRSNAGLLEHRHRQYHAGKLHDSSAIYIARANLKWQTYSEERFKTKDAPLPFIEYIEYTLKLLNRFYTDILIVDYCIQRKDRLVNNEQVIAESTKEILIIDLKQLGIKKHCYIFIGILYSGYYKIKWSLIYYHQCNFISDESRWRWTNYILYLNISSK